MKSKFFLPILAAVLLAGNAKAQYTANFQTNIISGLTSNWTGNYEVGNTTFADVLIVSNSVALNDSIGYLGFAAAGSNNMAIIAGTGSVWSNSSTLNVGESGAGNTLIITNGGDVYDAGGYIGSAASSSNNAVTVTGSGSVWTNNGLVEVGQNGSGNTLTINNGGAVYNTLGYIGTTSSSSNNAMTVTGAGSSWNNSSTLYIGDSGSGNTLTISNGTVTVGASLLISAAAGASNNILNVNGGQLTVTNGAINVGAGQFNLSGGTVLTKQLLATNVYSFININGGTLVSQSTTVSNGQNFVIGNTGGGATFTALGGTHTFQEDLYTGKTTSGNQLVITNAATVVNANGYIGYEGDNNAVTVTGAGSVWNNNGNLYVGESSINNTLTISGGGAVSNANGYIGDGGPIGYPFGFPDSCTVTVTGAGSVWNNSGNLYVGESGGSGNTLTISSGGAVSNTNGYIGNNGTASNNSVTVTGPGSVWNNSATLFVGYSGSGNTLTIANGGAVSNVNGYIGYSASDNNNAVTVTGPGSIWNNSGNLSVGESGSNNTLIISSGGAVSAQTLYIAHQAGSGGTVDLTGGTLTVAGVSIGGAGTLTVAGGTLYFGGLLAVGAGGYSTNEVQFLSGTVAVKPTGTLRLGSDVPVAAVDVVNQGVLQIQGSVFSFTAGLNNQSAYTIGNGQLITVQNGLTDSGGMIVEPSGVLSVDAINQQTGNLFLFEAAQLAVGSAWTNAGPISIQAGFITGGTVNNTDLIEGYGSVSAPLINLAGGTVLASGGLLALNGTSIQNQSGASFQIDSGATLRIGATLVNSGVIDNQGGVFEVSNASLTNNGVLTGYGTYQTKVTVNNAQAQFQGGPADIYGTYLNSGGATTTVAFATADFFGAVTNNAGGYFKNTSSQVTFFNTFYNNGSYISDPATNVFTAMLALGPNGVLTGGKSNLFVLQGDLTSANVNGLQIDGATLEFTSGAHNFTLAGTAYLGALQLDSGATLKFSGATLYVGEFNAVLSQITTPDTIFYDPTENPSLDGQTYDLSGGGLLEAVPEPGTWALVLVGVAALLRLRRGYGGQVRSAFHHPGRNSPRFIEARL